MNIKIGKYIKIYSIIWKQELKSKMSYKGDFLISLLGVLLSNVCGIIVWKVIFNDIQDINGWKYPQLLFLYAFTLVALAPVKIFFDNNWNLQKNVY